MDKGKVEKVNITLTFINLKVVYKYMVFFEEK